jgi:hypothetical protein
MSQNPPGVRSNLASRHDEPCHRNSQYLAAWTCARGGLLAIEEQ